MKSNVGDAVESFLNGNISLTKTWLRRASKVELLEFVSMMNDEGRDGLGETKRLLR